MNIKLRRLLLFFSCILIVVSIIFMFHPESASTMRSTAPPDDFSPPGSMILYHPYFSAYLVAGGRFAPPITVPFTMVWLLISLWKLIRDKTLVRHTSLWVFGIICTFFSVLTVILSPERTMYGYMIAGLIMIAGAIQIVFCNRFLFPED